MTTSVRESLIGAEVADRAQVERKKTRCFVEWWETAAWPLFNYRTGVMKYAAEPRRCAESREGKARESDRSRGGDDGRTDGTTGVGERSGAAPPAGAQV